MKRVQILIIAALFITFASCSKDDDKNGDTILTAPEAGYIPFYPGNYWVYEQYRIDTLGNETLLNHYDSIVITGTTVIDGKSYYVFEGTWMSGSLAMDTLNMLRDSSGYYLSPSGNVNFTDQNFTDTLHTYTVVNNHTGDTLFQAWYKMESQPQMITVPSGEFEALNYLGTIYTHNPNQGVQEIRYTDRYFTKNVGMIFDTYYYIGSPNRMERRLKHYYVNENSFTK